jgi:hypothetical protein
MTTNLIAPVFTAQAAPTRSSRYGFISTHDMLTPFRDAGYDVTNSLVIRTRRSKNRPASEAAPYVKHLVRLRHREAPVLPGMVYPEVIVINSHNGTSKFSVLAGLFRMICSNGLIVTDANFGGISIAHTRLRASLALDAVKELTHSAQLTGTKYIGDMMQKKMSMPEALDFAESLGTPYRPEDLIMVRRPEDHERNLWTTFNVIQENLTKGGSRPINPNGRLRRASPIRSIDRTVTMNTNLWSRAVEYLEVGR